MPTFFHVVCPGCHAVNRLPADRLDGSGACGKCHANLFSGQPVDLDESGFHKHIGRSDLPIVVDFWAPWCSPCRMMAPEFEEVARRLEPRYRFVKINTEEARNLASRFGIRSIPTLAIFHGGKEVVRQAGAMKAGDMIRWIETNSRSWNEKTSS
ncbi:MAG: thioredoxin TrxC [Betaproteobacteria bacterium]|nr:thioredoxin TrxC [Betaproteobacteria bacterium]